MKPVTTQHTNCVFRLVGGTKENDLPLYREIQPDTSYIHYSTWKLTDEERALIKDGGYIELAVWGQGHPPVSLMAVSSELVNEQ